MSPSLEHEAICELFRRAEPGLLRTLLGYAGVVLPQVDSVQDASEESGELVPTAFVADVVLKLGDGDDAHVLIIEVQRSADPDKRWSWPVYLATLRARHRCAVTLVVLTPRADVARWAATPIRLGPNGALVPIVLGPGQVPLEPEARPIEAPLSGTELVLRTLRATLHSAQDEGMCEAQRLGISLLVDERSGVQEVCYRLLEAMFGERFSTTMEEHMAPRNWIEDSPSLGKYYRQAVSLGEARGEAIGEARGEARGEAIGMARGKADAVLAVLGVRGVAVSEVCVQRVRACSDVARLDRWLLLAVTARDVRELWDK